MTETRWERMTAPELRALAERNAVVILPVAALEQHGPHLPVWTDSFIGHSVAIRAAELCADLPAVVLPPMWMALSEHHFPFGGTISRCAALRDAVPAGGWVFAADAVQFPWW
jgi:creatinine amidohydrolase